MNCSNIKPEDVFDSEYIKRYNELHEDIHYRLKYLHSTIIILEKINNFRFDLFLERDKTAFWDIIIWNFINSSIILICGLVSDTGTDTHTLTNPINS